MSDAVVDSQNTASGSSPRLALVADPALTPPAISIIDESDGYEKAVRGVQIHATRTGVGYGPNIVLTCETDDYVATSVTSQFPMLNDTTVGDDVLIAAVIRSAPPGSRWCEIDLEPGAVVFYGPGADHTGINPAGLSFAFAVTGIDELAENAELLGVDFNPVARGQVHLAAPTAASRSLGGQLCAVVEASLSGVEPERNREDDLLNAMTFAFADDRRSLRVGASRRLDNRHIVQTAAEYANAIQRIPSIAELCLATHVSERRLRTAFNVTFGMAPTKFFQFWALDLVRMRLLASHPAEATVTRIATDIGFGHLGRFAGRYRSVYGELPTATLHASP